MGQRSNQRARVSELMDGGDWACAYGQCGTLHYVCLELAQLIDEPELRAKASVVAESATRDLDAATERWSELSRELRRVQSVGAVTGGATW